MTWGPSFLTDPAALLNAGGKVLGYLVTFASHLLPSSVSTQFASAGAFMSSAPFTGIFGLMAYLLSPIITPSVFLGCMACLIDFWMVQMVLTLVFMVKGWLTGTGA
jgi:hypothetical protein